MTREIDLPRLDFQKATLDNGLRVVTCEMPHTRSVSVSIFVGVGSRYESAERGGISHFVEHLVFKGTERRPAPEEISETIESTGGILNAGTEQEFTVYWCKVATPYFDLALDLLLDMLRNSRFDAEGIEKERMVVNEELGMIMDQPSNRLDALMDEMLWPDHPLGRDVAGTEESVAAISRDMIVDHVEQYYSPANIVISVAGGVLHKDVVQQVEVLSRDWKRAKQTDWTPFAHVQADPQLRIEYRKTQQTLISIAVPGVSMVDPDQYALDLLSVILGEGMSSRLFVEIREKHGLAYDVHSGVSHFSDCGAFGVNAGVDPQRVYDAVQMILHQVGSVRDGVSDDELEKAKRLSTGRLMLRMEDSRAISGWMGNLELLLGEILDLDAVVDSLRSVTSSQIRDVARRLLVDDKLNMAVVGPTRARRRLEGLLKL